MLVFPYICILDNNSMKYKTNGNSMKNSDRTYSGTGYIRPDVSNWETDWGTAFLGSTETEGSVIDDFSDEVLIDW